MASTGFARTLALHSCTALLFMLPFRMTTASAQSVDPELCGTNGSVLSLARSGNTLYIGGEFSAVGPCMGSGVPVELSTGVPVRRFPRVSGQILAVVPDGDGGWFIGGQFAAVDGEPHANLAHVLASGRLARWAPGVGGEVGYGNTVAVTALALHEHALYVGGLFSVANGQPRGDLAAVDVRSGELTAWNPGADGTVRCLLWHQGMVYAGGDFTVIGGQPRSALAVLDARTGVAGAWNPHAAINRGYGPAGATRRLPSALATFAAQDSGLGSRARALPASALWQQVHVTVRSLVVHGHVMFAGGDFDSLGGAWRNSIAAVDLRSGRATAWDARLGPRRQYIAHGDWEWPYVAAVVIRGDAVYAAGSFDTPADGFVRHDLACFDADSGKALAFDNGEPGWSMTVAAMALSRDHLLVGGSIYNIGGAVRVNVAELDPVTGRATAWNPRADGPVEALAVSGNHVYLGGGFTCVHDWQARNCAAALDVRTGRLLPWDPAVDGYVQSLAVAGNTVYMLGVFHTVGGQARGLVAAVDATTAELKAWNPGPMAWTWPAGPALAVQGNTVYLGGYFDHLGGMPRVDVAAIDGTTGLATAWNPQASDLVESVLPAGDRIYIGGIFRRVDNQLLHSLAALDATTGSALAWNPGATGMFFTALAAKGNSIYVGGTLTSVGGVARSDLGAVDATTGLTLPWNPDVGGDYPAMNIVHITSLAVQDTTVWAGGRFATIGGRSLPYLAALGATSGQPGAWQASPDGIVHALCVSGDTVYVGGDFRSMNGVPHASVAALIRRTAGQRAITDVPGDPVGPQPLLLLARCVSNPVQSRAIIRYALARAGVVSIAVYDLQGRRVAQPLQAQFVAAGEHEVRIEAATWRPGCYLCRVAAAGEVITRRLVVIH